MGRQYEPQGFKGGQLVIPIKEARKLLGKDAHTLSDDQVEELIKLLTSMAEDLLQTNGSKVY